MHQLHDDRREKKAWRRQPTVAARVKGAHRNR
ncbi:hypothetical protein DSM3645_02638 [Blastopirellula marina DSM 3645]|uniref:Uncharacterized protein n=1 Tax=Blastopirellula marina DSM 3645 TaxID=314230 RepID=A3ZVJ1_9BACT|nr:hypothetical protein DSM3645_02638 [Blastopirellula marina DSM 3645]